MRNAPDSAAPMRSVEEVKTMLDTTEKGGVRNSIRNCLTVFQYDPLLAGALAYNLLTDRTDLVKPIGCQRPPGASMTDTDMKYIRLYLEETYGLTSERKIADAADLAAHQNSYHPVRDYLNGLEWDGTERIRFCLRHFLGAAADTYTCEALKLFLLGAIHRAYRPGCKFEVMLCLVGGQGAGKSTFFRLLAVRDEWFSDDLRRLDDDNVYRKLQGHWIIEMSEMIATANAKSIEEIKSFLSRQKEVYKIQKLYESYALEKISEKRFDDFLAAYEKEQAELKAVLETDTEELRAYEVDSDHIASFLKLARKYREADELTTPMIYAFVEKIIVHAPEKIDGERHMQIDIYLKFIGNFQVPQDEPTAEEMAEEEKQKQRRAKNREKVARCMERKKLKDAQEKEDAAHENDSAV